MGHNTFQGIAVVFYKEILVAPVIDEAHCVKNWGDKLGVPFARIGDLKSHPNSCQFFGLTPTAIHKTGVLSQGL